ncbi:odorant receptor 131-2-like [Leuresthes tenuis]|uniref:odorant receptor 131-2-like n=1 Tax=Leuresthes tenuis TaxID=355514 RepID=UPI003B512EB9
MINVTVINTETVADGRVTSVPTKGCWDPPLESAKEVFRSWLAQEAPEAVDKICETGKEFGEAMERNFWSALKRFWGNIQRLSSGQSSLAQATFGWSGDPHTSNEDIVGRNLSQSQSIWGASVYFNGGGHQCIQKIISRISAAEVYISLLVSMSNTTVGLVFLERVLYTTLTTVPCCIFLFINGTMLYTLRSKPVFRETCRYILLYNLLFADTVQLTVSQLLYILSIGRIFLTYPVCGVFFMLSNLTNPVSPLILVVMSLERCVAVCYPLRHASIITTRNTAVAVIVVWAICLLNVVIQILLMLEFPFEELETLQMNTFCNTVAMLLTPLSYDYEEAYIYFLFISSGVAIISTYIVVIIAARSASTNKASALKARNTVLMHLVQLGLSISSTLHNPLLIAVSKLVVLRVLLRIQNFFYVSIIILPRCLSALIYGLRDQTIRPVLMYNLCCRMKLSGISVKPKVCP